MVVFDMASEEYTSLLKENQELKKQYENAVADYETAMAEKVELKKQLEERPKEYVFVGNAQNKTRDFIDQIVKENKKLKKQLEEANKKLYLCTPEIPQNIHGKYVSYVDLVNEMYELKKQQKEFIKYLEYLIKQNETVVEVSKYGLPKNCSKLLIDFYKEILSKYREIIGDDK